MMQKHLAAMDRALTAKRFPPMSPWWVSTLSRFYEATQRQLVIRKGRRAGGSSTLCRVAVAEGLYGAHNIPPGDVGVIAFISVNRDEANQRLRTIRAILDALGIQHKPADGGVELVGRPVLFKTFAASISGVSGFTCICAICDEVSKWRDSDSGANPATEVLASLRPTMATQRNARIFMSSSPLSTVDAHAVAFDAGDSDFQLTAFAETWVANPTLTEADTHKLETDPRIWAREYAASPSSSVSAALDPEHVERMFKALPVDAPLLECESVLVLDPSGLKNDTFTFGIARWLAPPSSAVVTQRKYIGEGIWIDEPVIGKDGNTIPLEEEYRLPPMLRFEYVDGYSAANWIAMSADQMTDQIAMVARKHGARTVLSDQRDAFQLESAWTKRGFLFRSIPWTSDSKARNMSLVRGWLRDGQLRSVEHAKLKKEMLTLTEKVTPNGTLSVGARSGGHDDYWALVLTLAHGVEAGLVPGSPLGRRVHRSLANLPSY